MLNRKYVSLKNSKLLAISSLSIIFFMLSTTESIAQKPSQIYMLGDSSADVGTDGESYSNLGNMWIETFSNRLGFSSTPARYITPDGSGAIDITTAPITVNGGTNYAVGGATAVRYAGLVNFADQMLFFKQDHASIDKDALIFLWMGSNDPAQSELLGLPYDPDLYASTYIDTVKDLKSMGAKNIVAMGEPVNLIPNQLYLDLGVPQADIDIHKDNVTASNAALWPQLQKENVYVIDVDKLGNDILNDITKYGFTVGTEGYMTLGDPSALPNDGHIFANNHYSSQMHDVIADYTAAQLRARDQYTHLLTSSMRQLQQNIASTNHLQSNTNQRNIGQWIVYNEANAQKSKTKSTGGTDASLHSDVENVKLGSNVLVSKDTLIGGEISYRRNEGKFGESSGKYTNNAVNGTVYASTKITENLHTNLALSYGQTDYTKIKRQTKLGSVATASAFGNTTGSEYAADVEAEYEIPVNNWTITPSVSVTYARSNIKGYEEKESVLALAYGESHLDSVQGTIGISAKMNNCQDSICPYASASIDHEFLQNDVKTLSGPNKNMLVSYSSERPANTTGHLSVGTLYAINDDNQINFNISTSKTIGKAKQQQTQDISASINILHKF